MSKGKKQTLPKVDDMTALLAIMFMGNEEDYEFEYPQWALDEEEELYGTTVIKRTTKGFVQDVYNYCREDGLTEEEAVKAVQDRILFNKRMN